MSITKSEIKRKLSVVKSMVSEAERLLDEIKEMDESTYMDMIENQMELIGVILGGIKSGKLRRDEVVDDKFLRVLKGVTDSKKKQLDIEMDALQAELINDIKKK